jgi:hypothetical protein
MLCGLGISYVVKTLSCSVRMPLIAAPFCFVSTNGIWCRLQTVKLISWLHPVPNYFVLLKSVFFTALVTDMLNLSSLLNVTGQVSHLYKRTGNIILLILNFIFLDSWQEGKGILNWDVVSIPGIVMYSFIMNGFFISCYNSLKSELCHVHVVWGSCTAVAKDSGVLLWVSGPWHLEGL